MKLTIEEFKEIRELTNTAHAAEVETLTKRAEDAESRIVEMEIEIKEIAEERSNYKEWWIGRLNESSKYEKILKSHGIDPETGKKVEAEDEAV